MEHFNRLTPAEAERLALIAEEMGEVLQVIGKILRHGYESRSPIDVTSQTNRQYLERELGDVTFAIALLFMNGDIDPQRVEERAVEKEGSIQKWLHHQEVAP